MCQIWSRSRILFFQIEKTVTVKRNKYFKFCTYMYVNLLLIKVIILSFKLNSDSEHWRISKLLECSFIDSRQFISSILLLSLLFCYYLCYFPIIRAIFLLSLLFCYYPCYFPIILAILLLSLLFCYYPC